MSFAYSAGVITQSGTDTSLAGLTGLTGVTTYTLADGTVGGYKLYWIQNTSIIINGTLSWNPNTERVVFDTNAPDQTFTVEGTCTIDGSNYTSQYSSNAYALTFLKLGAHCCGFGQSSLAVNSSATFTLKNAYIYTNYMMFWVSGSTININNAKIISNRIQADQIRVRNFCSNLTITNCEFSNISIDFFRPPTSLSGLSWFRSNVGFQLVSTAVSGTDSVVTFSGAALTDTDWISNYAGAKLTLKNPPINTKYKVENDGGFVDNEYAKSFTKVTADNTFALVDVSLTAITNTSIFMRDVNNSGRTNATYNDASTENFTNDRTYFLNTSNGSGISTVQNILLYVVRGGVISTNTDPIYDFRDKTNSEQNVFDFIFARYGNRNIVAPVKVFGDVGGATRTVQIQLLTDNFITVSNTTTVGGYSTGQTDTTGAKLYDFAALNKTLESGIEFPTPSTRVFDSPDGISLTCNYNLSISSANTGISINHGTQSVTIPPLIVGGRFTGFVLGDNRTLTFAATGTYSSIPFTIPATGTVVVAGGSTNLQGWTGNGATINAPSAATVTVDNVADWVAGANVTLTSPQASVVAANFANDTRVQVSHRQIFTIASTAINTSTDVITLGNDSNGDAANFRTTSPNTLVRFQLTSGAAIPTSTPQIFDGGLYYWKSGGQLSIAEGGTAINFTTQGSGNFTLIAETEIDNSVVSGGSGYSFAVTRPNNARLRIKAVHWSSSGGIAACSQFYDQVFAWSSTAGITILDTVNNTVASSQDAIHQQLVAINNIDLEGPVIDSTGARITSITLPDDGSTVTGLAIALEGTGKVQINANDTNGFITWQELYLWGCYIRSTQAGIRLSSANTLTANSIYNFTFSNLEIDNISSIVLQIVGGIGRSADGASLISASTTGAVALNAVSQGTGAVVSTGGGGSGGFTGVI